MSQPTHPYACLPRVKPLKAIFRGYCACGWQGSAESGEATVGAIQEHANYHAALHEIVPFVGPVGPEAVK